MQKEKTYLDLLEFPIIHGRHLCNEVIVNCAIFEKKITVSNDIQILTVVDKYNAFQNLLSKTSFESANVHVIVIDEYIKWISKIKSLKEYIEKEYDNLPSYILYLDGFDTLILQDILEPKKILDFYNCKLLFNMETNFVHTGFPEPSLNYFDDLYYREASRAIMLNEKKYGFRISAALNAGVFLGEKDYVLQILKETLDYMLEDYNKGYPYGCLDDQCLLRFVHNEHFDDISIDLFNKFCFWGSKLTFEDFSENNIFGIGYTQKYLKQYIDGKY